MSWKTVAIIFIILFVAETIIFVGLMNMGLDMVEKEKTCAYDICEDYYSYSYDDYEEVCYCYNWNHEIAKTEYLGDD